MQSGILVYSAEQGEYCGLAIYDSEIIKVTFELMKRAGPPILNMKISNSKKEIKTIDKALEGILKKINMAPILNQEREAKINSAFD